MAKNGKYKQKVWENVVRYILLWAILMLISLVVCHGIAQKNQYHRTRGKSRVQVVSYRVNPFILFIINKRLTRLTLTVITL